jgi:heme a synthase
MTDDLKKIRSSNPVATWLMIGVAMLIIQILLGGITRLTGSGLSITEWDVVTGSLPPMNEQQWLLEFEKYKLTPQFSLLNFDFKLPDFKFIFFWEWFHRFWARLIGIVFAVPFIIFLVQKRFKPSMVKPLLILFLLGALQGAVGWIMVASGLTGDAIYVKPTRLALHFILAMCLLCYTFWFALQLLIPNEKLTQNTAIRKVTLITIILLGVQLLYGALMAGHKAATAAATWPDINGSVIPDSMFKGSPMLLNFIDNKITIHFIHRLLAYVLFVVILFFCIQLRKQALSAGNSLLRKTWWLPFFVVTVQVVLGIASVLTSLQIIPNRWGNFEWMAQLHQLTAMFLLLSLIWFLFIVRTDKKFSR